MTPAIEGQIGAGLRTLLNNNGLSNVKVIGYEVYHIQTPPISQYQSSVTAQLGHSGRISRHFGRQISFWGALQILNACRCKMMEIRLPALLSIVMPEACPTKLSLVALSHQRYIFERRYYNFADHPTRVFTSRNAQEHTDLIGGVISR